MTINEKTFNATLKNIKANAEKLAESIHQAGLFAIAQANEHGNIGFGSRLVEAMGKKHDAQRVVTWLCHFGKFGVKNGELVFRARKDIGPENLDAMLNAAEEKPYWELTAQKKLVQKVDYLAMLNAILHRHESVERKQSEGVEVTEENVAVLEEVRALIARHQAAAKVAPVLDAGVAAGC